MMKRSGASGAQIVYQAPTFYVGCFYFLLLSWTVVSIYFVGEKTMKVGWPLGQLLMIAFVLAYTWYFSLGISYRFSVGTDGMIHLTSFRKIIHVDVKNISTVEGPRFALLPYAFIRFKLEREKAYLFSDITDRDLQRALSALRSANRDLKFKGL